MTIRNVKYSLSRSQGFTLLEVLVASMIFTTLIGSLTFLFHGSLKLRETAFEAMERELPESYFATILKRDLSSMAQPAGILAGPILGETDQKGAYRRDRLEFYTTSGIVNDREPWGDIQFVSYELLEPETSDSSAAGYDLCRAVTRNLLSSVIEEPEEKRLIHGVENLALSYYDGEVWLDSWDSTTMDNKAPVAVKFSLEFIKHESGTLDIKPLEIVCEIDANSGAGQGSANEAAR